MAVWVCENCGCDNDCSVETDITKSPCDACGEYPSERLIIDALKIEKKRMLQDTNLDMYYEHEKKEIMNIINSSISELDKVNDRLGSALIFNAAVDKIMQIHTKEQIDEIRKAEEKERLLRQEKERQEKEIKQKYFLKRKKRKKRIRNLSFLTVFLGIFFAALWYIHPVLEIMKETRSNSIEKVSNVYEKDIQGNTNLERILNIYLSWEDKYRLHQYNAGKFTEEEYFDWLSTVQEINNESIKQSVSTYREELSELVESKNSYVYGCEALESKDYIRAISELKKVKDNDKNHKDAQKQLDFAIAEYKLFLQESVKDNILSGNMQVAIAACKQGYELIPEDYTISAMQECIEIAGNPAIFFVAEQVYDEINVWEELEEDNVCQEIYFDQISESEYRFIAKYERKRANVLASYYCGLKCYTVDLDSMNYIGDGEISGGGDRAYFDFDGIGWDSENCVWNFIFNEGTYWDEDSKSKKNLILSAILNVAVTDINSGIIEKQDGTVTVDEEVVSVEVIQGEEQGFMENGMVFADSDKRYLSREEIEALQERPEYSYQQLLRFAVNEIYARYGYKFKEDGIYWSHYNNFEWYSSIEKRSVETSELNEFEKRNIELLVSIERENGFQ